MAAKIENSFDPDTMGCEIHPNCSNCIEFLDGLCYFDLW